MKNKIFIKSIASVVMLAFMILSTGCGAIFKGSSQNIMLISSPDAKVTVQPGGSESNTPTTLDLDRGKSYVLEFSKEGYDTKKVDVKRKASVGIIVLDVLFTGLLGVIIDAATGSWYNLKPDQISVSLTKSGSGFLNIPSEIIVTLTEMGEDKVEISSSEPGVVVKVIKESRLE